MKLCFFVDDITKVGGIERVTTTLVNNLSDFESYDITISSIFHGRQSPNYKISEKVKIDYITNKCHGQKPHSFERIKNLIKAIPKIRKYFNNNQFDIIVAQSFPPAIALYLCGKSSAKKIVAEHVFAQYYTKPIQLIRKYIYKQFDRLIVLTSKDKEFFDTQLPSSQTTVIPNPVVLKDSGKAPLDSKKIISVGRLEYQKGFDTLINCFYQISRQYPDWILEIYGEGSLRDELQSLISKYKMEKIVLLRGHTSDINTKFKEAAFYVMSSRFEGFPMVLIEAMNQGIPCISFDCPNGPSDILENGVNGILVKDQSPDDLQKAIIRLIENKSERNEMGIKASHSVEKYNEKNIANMWDELFDVLTK